MYNDLPAAIGPDTITNPAYTEKGFFDKLSYLKDQGFNKSVNNAITGNPIATTAAGLGLLGGGTGSLSNPAPQPAIPDFTTAGKTYAKRPYQKQGVARSFVDAPDGYRPGFDPERSYLSPISTYNQGFATGGLAALMPKVPKITPAMSFGGGDVTSNPSNPSDVNDVTNDTDFGQPDSTPAPPESSFSIGEAVASGVLGALTGGVLTGAVSAFTNAGMQAMGAPTVMGVAADAFTGGQTSTGTGGMSGADISDVNDAANDTGFGPPDGAPGSNSGGAGSSGGQGDPDGPGGAVGDDSSNWAVGGGIEDGAEQENPIITNAKAAIAGQHPEPQKAIGQFVQVYGDKAFMQLRNQVIAEQSLDQREDAGLGGMITGPGTGTSDSIPAKITQNGKPVEDIRVADGEYILPDTTVEKIGKDNLDEIVMATNGKQPNQS